MRQDYDQIKELGAEVVSIGADSPEAFHRFWNEHDIPFVGLSDPTLDVLVLYEQEVKLIRGGRMPALLIIDSGGRIRYRHYGASMSDVVDTSTVMEVLSSMADGDMAATESESSGRPSVDGGSGGAEEAA